MISTRSMLLIFILSSGVNIFLVDLFNLGSLLFIIFAVAPDDNWVIVFEAAVSRVLVFHNIITEFHTLLLFLLNIKSISKVIILRLLVIITFLILSSISIFK